ncbi:MAG: DASS family sodium-coupled anion symporter [Alphaproteobacteria bacterium]|nr:DASS family sodium-coupled anion symporter [Alphaproteobacteria bacterium]
MKYSNIIFLVFLALLGFCCFSGCVPPFDVLPIRASALFFIFISIIASVVMKGARLGVASFCGLSLISIAGIMPFSSVMYGFSHGTPWLIFFAFCFSKAFMNSGLDKYISSWLMKRVQGSAPLFLRWVVTLDFVIAPFVPSNAARAGSSSVPIISGVIHQLKAQHGSKANSTVHYLVMGAFIGNLISSATFLTGTAPNLLALSLAQEITQYSITWLDWFAYMAIPAVMAVSGIFFGLSRIMGIKKKDFLAIEASSTKDVKVGGKMYALIGIFLVVLFLWMFGRMWGISESQSAFLGVALLVLTNVLSWDDVIKNEKAWDNFFWYGAFLAIASGLGKMGVFVALGDMMSSGLSDFSPIALYLIGGAVYVTSHYLFAGISPHVVSLLPVFLLMFLAKGVPPFVAVMTLSSLSVLSAAVTHFGSTVSPLFYGLNAVSTKVWWRVGGQCGLFFTVVMLGYGLCVWALV